VNVLHHDLEPIEASRLGYLYLATKALYQILVDDTVRSGEEGEDVGDEEALVVVEALVPIVEVLGEIDLFGGPEGGFGLLVHVPDLSWPVSVMFFTTLGREVRDALSYRVVLDGEEHETLGVLLKQRLVCFLFLDRGRGSGL
jgi:hypothetical protein